MAIHPNYANAILDGVKKIEFRKRRLASDIEIVLIYATSPISQVVGRFRVGEIVDGTPAELWNEWGSVGEIGHEDFCKYYGESSRAVGFVVENPERLPLSLALGELTPSPAIPQSFSYVPATIHYRGGCLSDPDQFKLW